MKHWLQVFLAVMLLATVTPVYADPPDPQATNPVSIRLSDGTQFVDLGTPIVGTDPQAQNPISVRLSDGTNFIDPLTIGGGSGDGVPGGPSASVQYNAGSGNFGGEAAFSYNATTNTTTLENVTITGTVSGALTSFSATPTGIFDVATATTTPALSLDNQAANIVLAGPTSGGAATPSFRALVAGDIPSLNTSILNAGTLGIVRGGTNNGSLGVSALGIYNGDGSKVVQTTASAGQSWRVNAGGTAVEAYTPSAGGTPAGSDKQVQFNDGGSAFGADAGFTYDKTTDVLATPVGGTFGTSNIASLGEAADGAYLYLANDGHRAYYIDSNDNDTLRFVDATGGNTAFFVTINGFGNPGFQVNRDFVVNQQKTTLYNGDAGIVNTTIKGKSGQTANLMEFNIEGGSALASVSAAGVIAAPNMTVSKNVNTTPVGNIGAGEDDLITYSLTAATLANAGDCAQIDAFGTFANNANAKQVKLKFGSTTIFASGSSVALSNGSWHISAKVIRTGAATQIASATFNGFTAVVTSDALYTEPGETLSGAVTIKCTGEATSDDDIIQKGLIVRYLPNL